MKMHIEVDATEYHAAMKQILLKSSRTLAQSLNSMIFFLLVRLFVILPPLHPKQKRNQVKEYLDTKIGDVNRFDKKTGKRIGVHRIRHVFSRVHKIIQSKRGKAGQKGLYGEEMRKEAASFRRRAIGSVGFLKSTVLRAITLVNGRFIQAGRPGKEDKKGNVIRKATYRNSALTSLQAEYGINIKDAGNVSRHKGSWVNGSKAKESYNPVAWVKMFLAVQDGQESRVNQIMETHLQRALNDERDQMLRYLASQLQPIADEHNGK